MKHRDVERRLRRLAPPPPPPELRDRVLRAAAAALVAPRPHAGVAERLWFSRACRLAWVATIAALLLVEAVSYRRVERRFAAPDTTTPSPVAEVVRELGLEPDWRATVVVARVSPALDETWIEAR